MNRVKIAIASDHAGFDLKSFLIKELHQQYSIIDCGCKNSENSVDYPDFSKHIADKMLDSKVDFGILICGSGIGVSIAVNRFKQIRGALCYNQKTTKISRQHNDANVLCLGARITKPKNALMMVETFLKTKFLGGRHSKRVNKLSELN